MRKALRAHAKVNFVLEVLKRRCEDGYHEISSLMANISLADFVLVEILDAETFKLDWAGPTPPPSPNLCQKALRLFQEEFGWPLGARIRVEKRIPIAAGLGGGSADAAAVLMGLAELAPFEITREGLLSLAPRIGADVPFFLVGGAAICEGIGERIRPLRHAEYWLVLCGPEVEVSAGEAYGLWDERPCKLQALVWEAAQAFERGDPEGLAPYLQNALFPAVSQKFPIVRDLLAMVREAGALRSTMTGSGPTVLGLARNKHHAREVCRKIKGKVAWAKVAKTVSIGIEP